MPYYCPVCPTKKLISPMNVDSHINGKSHQKMLIMQKSGKHKSNTIASSSKNIKSAEDNRDRYVPFYCTVCPSKLVHPLNAENHFMGEIHKKNLMDGQGKSVNKLKSARIEQELSKAVDEVNSREGMEGKMIEISEIKMKTNKSYAGVVLDSSNEALKSIWECKRCSYHNLPEDQTCLMCSNVGKPWKQEMKTKNVSEDQNPQNERLSTVSRPANANVQGEIWEHHSKEIPRVMFCASENSKLHDIGGERN